MNRSMVQQTGGDIQMTVSDKVVRGKDFVMETSKDDDDLFEVGNILAHKHQDGKLYYLVRWEGYSLYESTWEPQHNLSTASPIVTEYHIHLERVQRGESPPFDVQAFEREKQQYDKQQESEVEFSDYVPKVMPEIRKPSGFTSNQLPQSSKPFSKLKAEHRALVPLRSRSFIRPTFHSSPPKISFPPSSLLPPPRRPSPNRKNLSVHRVPFHSKREPAPDLSAVDLSFPGNVSFQKKRVPINMNDRTSTTKFPLQNSTTNVPQLPTFKKRPNVTHQSDAISSHPRSSSLQTPTGPSTGPPTHHKYPCVPPVVRQTPRSLSTPQGEWNPPTGPSLGRKNLARQNKQSNPLDPKTPMYNQEMANVNVPPFHKWENKSSPKQTSPLASYKNESPSEVTSTGNSTIWKNPTLTSPISIQGNQIVRGGRTVDSSMEVDRPPTNSSPPSVDSKTTLTKHLKPLWSGDLIYGADKSLAGKIVLSPTAYSTEHTLLESLCPTLWLSKQLGISYLITFKQHFGFPKEIYNIDFSESLNFNRIFDTLEGGDSVGLIYLDNCILVLFNSQNDILKMSFNSATSPGSMLQIAVFPPQAKTCFAKDLPEWKSSYNSTSLAGVLLSQTVHLPYPIRPFLFSIWSPKETPEREEMAMIMRERNGIENSIYNILESLKSNNTLLGIILVHRLWFPLIDDLPSLQALKECESVEFYVFGTDIEFVEADTFDDPNDIICIPQARYKIEPLFPSGGLYFPSLELYTLKPKLIRSLLIHLKRLAVFRPFDYESLVVPTNIFEYIDEKLQQVGFSELWQEMKYLKLQLEQEIEQDSKVVVMFEFNHMLLSKPYDFSAIEYLMKQCQYHLCTEYRNFCAITLEQHCIYRGGISYLDQEFVLKKVL